VCQYQNNNDPCDSDSNECTDDQCSDGACTHENNETPCADDGDECTTDVCGGGLCTHPANGQCGCEQNPDCDDSNPCTDDTCDNNGECQYANNTNPCLDDGNACTADVCEEGRCAHLLQGEPIPEKSAWVASASHVPQVPIVQCPGDPTQPAAQAVDGMLATRWTSGKVQAGDEWVQIDFGAAVTLNRINLDQVGLGEGNCTVSSSDFPLSYEVRLTNSPANNEVAALATGEGTVDKTMIHLEQPATGRYLLISQVESAVSMDPARWWSIHEINVACQ
jgi:hypothetical protein